MSDLTELLRAWKRGDPEALDRLAPQVYAELRRLAHRYLCCEGFDQTLETGDLVNEAFLRLVDQRQVHWHNRDQFFRLSARLMRRVLVDRARRRRAEKRGGGLRRVTMVESGDGRHSAKVEVLVLDQALARLERQDPDQAAIVDLRFFAGLTIDETARVVGRSPMTVKREWALAKAWLARALAPEPARAS